MTTAVSEESIDLQVQILTMAVNGAEEREMLAVNNCIKAVSRSNRLTADLVRMQSKYWHAAGYPFAIDKPC